MDLERQRQKLLEMLAEDSLAVESEPTGLRDYSHELTVFDNHPADIASENYLKSLDTSLAAFNHRQLNQVKHALARIDSGDYLHCSSCHQPIETKRLEALPTTDLCLKCSERQSDVETAHLAEGGYLGNGRMPVLESYGSSDSEQEQARGEE